MVKRTKKYLEQENKWLWYRCYGPDDGTEPMEIIEYNEKGEAIRYSTVVLPSKKHRPKHPSGLNKTISV